MGRGTRERLNAGFLQGSLLLATLIGLLFGSWTVFFIALVVALVGNVCAGEIRSAARTSANLELKGGKRCEESICSIRCASPWWSSPC